MEYQRFISQRVLTDEQPVTYKLVSRHFDINVNDSKKILYTFYENNKDQCVATYVITGVVDGKKQIKLTSNLSAKSEFDSVTSLQLFSVKSNKTLLSIDNLITSINDDLKKYPTTAEKCDKWGVIKCPELVIQADELEQVVSKKHDIQKDDPKPLKKLTTTATTAKKDPFAMSSLYTSRKKQKETAAAAAAAEPASKPKYQYVSRKPTQEKPKVQAHPKPVKKIDSDLQALFDDDDDDDFKDETFEEDKKEKSPVEIQSILDEKTHSIQEIPNPELEKKDTEVETEDTQDKLEEPEVDEDGYIITKKKTATAVAPASKRKNTNTTVKSTPSNNKQKKQSSLMNFFGKR